MRETKIFFHQVISQICQDMLHVILMGVKTRIICSRESNAFHIELVGLKQSEWNTNLSCLVSLSIMNAPSRQLFK